MSRVVTRPRESPSEEQPYPGLTRLGERQPLHRYLRDIWRRKDFLLALPLGQLRMQHQNTVLGSVWHLLNPLLLTLVFYVIFGLILPVRGGIENYAGFLVVGVLTFNYTQKALMAGSRTVVANVKLIQNIRAPRAVLPIGAVLGETIAHGPALVALAIMIAATGEAMQASWLLLLPVVALQGMFNLGLSFFAARLTFHFRDVEQILPFLLRLWLYLSGVFFAASFVPAGWPRTVFELNPMNAFIVLARGAMMDGYTPPKQWLIAGAWALILPLTGFVYFRGREGEYGRG